MNRKLVSADLRAISALAEVLADDVAEHRLWEGEFERRLAAIRELVEKATNASRATDT